MSDHIPMTRQECRQLYQNLQATVIGLCGSSDPADRAAVAAFGTYLRSHCQECGSKLKGAVAGRCPSCETVQAWASDERPHSG